MVRAADERPAVARAEAEASLDLGRAAYRSGDLEGALAHFRESARRDDTFVPAHLWLSNVYIRQERMDDADREARRALELEGVAEQRGAAYHNLCRTAEARRRHAEAVAACERSLVERPGNPQVLERLASLRARAETGRDDLVPEALAGLDSGGRGAEGARAAFEKARILVRGDDHAGAVPVLREAVAADPENVEYRIWLSCELSEIGQHSEAARIAQTASGAPTGDTNRAAAAFCYGLALEGLGRTEEAVRSYEQSLRLRHTERAAAQLAALRAAIERAWRCRLVISSPAGSAPIYSAPSSDATRISSPRNGIELGEVGREGPYIRIRAPTAGYVWEGDTRRVCDR